MRPKGTCACCLLPTPERVPAVIFGGGFFAAKQAGKSFRELLKSKESYAETVLGMQRSLQSDMVFVGSGLNNLVCKALSCEVRVEQSSLQVLTHITPEKELVGRVNQLEEIATLRQGFQVVNEELGDRYLVAVTSWGALHPRREPRRRGKAHDGPVYEPTSCGAGAGGGESRNRGVLLPIHRPGLGGC